MFKSYKGGVKREEEKDVLMGTPKTDETHSRRTLEVNLPTVINKS